MKLSFSRSSSQYVITNLGQILDADDDLSVLMKRHGMLSDEKPTIPMPQVSENLVHLFSCLQPPEN